MDMPIYILPDEWDGLTEDERQQLAAVLAEERAAAEAFPQKSIACRGSFYAKYGKRILDVLLSGAALILCLPINLILAIVTYFDVGRPILFRQERVGRGGKLFYLTKFRNMTNATNARGILLSPEARVTRWGKFVRKTSLDELLNFWSVFKGDMSLIGPRPLPKKYRNRFSYYHQQRHLVRPGLECPFHDPALARKGWQGRLDNDVWYVEHLSFATDVRMMLLLVKKVFSRKERAESANGQVGEFMGYNPDGTVIDSNTIPHRYLDRTGLYIEQ